MRSEVARGNIPRRPRLSRVLIQLLGGRRRGANPVTADDDELEPLAALLQEKVDGATSTRLVDGTVQLAVKGTTGVLPAVVMLAEEAGFECLVPIARWKGFGGETDVNGASFETITWACGLLAHRRNA